MGRMRFAGPAIGATIAVALITSSAFPAQAAPRTKAGTWGQLTTTSAQVAPGFPSATIATTPTTASTVAAAETMTAATPPGGEYGTSAGSTYLAVAPASATVPSSTTITFATPTPPEFWSFVFGDVDAESVQISATDPSGPLTDLGGLGFQGSFNSTANPADTDTPTWTAGTGTLAGHGPNSNGAAAWFSPTVPLTSITFTSTRLTGSPQLQFWMVGLTASLSGRVVDTAGLPVPNATVTVENADGSALPGPPATAVTDADGAYDIPIQISSDPDPAPLQVVVTPADRAAPDPVEVTAVPVEQTDGSTLFLYDAVDVTTAALPTAPPVTTPTAPVSSAPELAATGVSAPPWLIVGAGAAVLIGAALAVTAGVLRRHRR